MTDRWLPDLEHLSSTVSYLAAEIPGPGCTMTRRIDPQNHHLGTLAVVVAAAAVALVTFGIFLPQGGDAESCSASRTIRTASMMDIDQEELETGTGDTRPENLPYGRRGTLDPGDVVCVEPVRNPNDVATLAESGEAHYGQPGEVLVFFKSEDKTGTPIIHRAVTFVTVQGEGASRAYEVRWSEAWNASRARSCHEQSGGSVCTFGPQGVTIPSLGLEEASFEASGFITKGDQNPGADQAIGVYSRLVPLDQVQGVARGETVGGGLDRLASGSLQGNSWFGKDHPYWVSYGYTRVPKDILRVAALEERISLDWLEEPVVDVGVRSNGIQLVNRSDNRSGTAVDPGQPLTVTANATLPKGNRTSWRAWLNVTIGNEDPLSVADRTEKGDPLSLQIETAAPGATNQSRPERGQVSTQSPVFGTIPIRIGWSVTVQSFGQPTEDRKTETNESPSPDGSPHRWEEESLTRGYISVRLVESSTARDPRDAPMSSILLPMILLAGSSLLHARRDLER